MKLAALFAALFLALAACASVPTAPPSADQAAKSFTPMDGKAGVYVYRASSMGMTELYDVYLDGRNLGGLAPGTYHHVEVEPGEHRVSVTGGINIEQETETFLTEAGRNYYLEAAGDVGIFFATVSLYVIDDEGEAQAAIRGLELAQKL